MDVSQLKTELDKFTAEMKEIKQTQKIIQECYNEKFSAANIIRPIQTNVDNPSMQLEDVHLDQDT